MNNLTQQPQNFNIIEVLKKYPDAMPGIMEVVQPQKVIHQLQYKYRAFETEFNTDQQRTMRQVLVSCSAQLFKEHMERPSSSTLTSRAPGDLLDYSWNIYYSLEKLNLDDFLNFQHQALKNISHLNTVLTAEVRNFRTRSALRTLFACWVKYSSICSENDTDTNRFYNEANKFFKIIQSKDFLSKTSFSANPSFFLEKSSLVFPLHIHMSKNRTVRLQKALTFMEHYLQKSFFKNNKAKKDLVCVQEYENHRRAVFMWLEKEGQYLSIIEQQEFLKIYAKVFKTSEESAKNKALSSLTNHLNEYFAWANTDSKTSDYHKETQWKIDVFRSIYLLKFEEKELSSLSSKEINLLHNYLREQEYLLQCCAQWSYGKILPLTYLLKTMYLDRAHLIKTYSHKYKSQISTLNLDLEKFQDFKTFVILFTGHDFIEKSQSYAKSRFQKLLEHQKEKIEKKLLSTNLNISTTLSPIITVSTKKKFKL